MARDGCRAGDGCEARPARDAHQGQPDRARDGVRDVGLPVSRSASGRSTTPGRCCEKEYIATGKVRWIFINYPLVSIHPNAVPAAELVMCAGRAGKFWEAHDLVFRTQKVWAPLKDPGPFLGVPARQPQAPQARGGAVPREGGNAGGDPERRGGIDQGGRAEHADVLHRRRADAGCAAGAAVPAGPRFDLSGQDEEVGPDEAVRSPMRPIPVSLLLLLAFHVVAR